MIIRSKVSQVSVVQHIKCMYLLYCHQIKDLNKLANKLNLKDRNKWVSKGNCKYETPRNDVCIMMPSPISLGLS